MTDLEQDCRLVAEWMGWKRINEIDPDSRLDDNWYRRPNKAHNDSIHIGYLRNTGNGMVKVKTELVNKGWYVRTTVGELANCELYQYPGKARFQAIAEPDEPVALIRATAQMIREQSDG